MLLEALIFAAASQCDDSTLGRNLRGVVLQGASFGHASQCLNESSLESGLFKTTIRGIGALAHGGCLFSNSGLHGTPTNQKEPLVLSPDS